MDCQTQSHQFYNTLLKILSFLIYIKILLKRIIWKILFLFFLKLFLMNMVSIKADGEVFLKTVECFPIKLWYLKRF